MDILIAMPVFKRELLALNSIRSIVDSIYPTQKSLNVTFAIALNEANDELRFELAELARENTNIKIHDFGENLGKGIAVNKLASLYKFDYIISMDSDMICTNHTWLYKMMFAYKEWDKVARWKLGSLCVNQLGNNCHTVTVGKNECKKIKIATGINLVTQDLKGGVAGGALMSSAKVWNSIRGYRASKLYGTDDGHFNEDCTRLKLMVGYIDEVKFYHPYEFDGEYKVWKRDMMSAPEEFQPFSSEKKKM
jgi:glycosyltransferase involved in cell wall biosynthesis